MKQQTYIFILTLTAAVFLSHNATAQSISGTITSFVSNAELGYANVDLYKGTDLVASVLADRHGNFIVKLDTGTYRAEILYAGYKTMTQEIHVKDDENADFGLMEDKASKYISNMSKTRLNEVYDRGR